MNLVLDDLKAAQRHLIGVSGGRDSVALLHRLHELGFKRLVVCHVNHKLRGAASTHDALFVKRLAKQLGYTCESIAIDIAKAARETKQSVETCARAERFRFFAAMAAKHRCPRVILAHHSDDQAETVLMRVLRGTGIGGLAGIKAERTMQIGRRILSVLRPMLNLRRAQIDDYIRANDLCFCEDLTNADPKHARNRVRHELLPMLSEAAGRDVAPMLHRLADVAAREDDYLRQQMLALIEHESLIADDVLVLRPRFKATHPALQHRVMHHWLQQLGVGDLDHELITQAVRLITERTPARINLPGDAWLRRKAGRLWVERVAGR